MPERDTPICPAWGDAPAEPARDAATVAYALDAEGRITAVNPAWDAFAATNGGPPGASVIGTRLLDHVADATTRHLYRDLLARVRERQQVLRLPFRCDSPTVVREMELEIAPGGDGALVIYARLLRRRERAAVALLDARVPRGGPMLRLCGWCRRVHLDGAWRELEDAVVAHGLLCESPLPHTTHGICEDCQRAVLEALDEPAGEGADPRHG